MHGVLIIKSRTKPDSMGIYILLASIFIFAIHVLTIEAWSELSKSNFPGSIGKYNIFGINTPFRFDSAVFLKQLLLLLSMGIAIFVASIKAKKYGIVPNLILAFVAGTIFKIYPVGFWWLQGDKVTEIIDQAWAYYRYPVLVAILIYLFMRALNKKGIQSQTNS